ncbi:MAG TPA: SRPBCC family protein [Gemmatimonadaceae bacterium]|nr:SRPBCC family protein [Gemmatimonadaceae bacterium]
MESSFETDRAGGGSAITPRVRPRAESIRPYQRLADEDRGMGGESLANFLGLFSIGLGLAEALIPGSMAKLIGVSDNDDNRRLMRVFGVREIASGVAILTNQQPTKSVWARVAGDALDLACLGVALANPDNDRNRTLFATANVLAVTALDITCARTLSKQPDTRAHEIADEGIIHTKKAITVGRPAGDVYAFWRNFENFPRFMRHLESVRVTGGNRSHWKAKAPAGKSVEWDAVMTEDRPNELIAWRSTDDADVYNRGTVRFRPAPGGRGTEVRVDLEYDPPLGKLGSKLAMMFREEPGQQIEDDLRHFKQVMEIGEIVVSDATVNRGPHPGQPS